MGEIVFLPYLLLQTGKASRLCQFVVIAFSSTLLARLFSKKNVEVLSLVSSSAAAASSAESFENFDIF